MGKLSAFAIGSVSLGELFPAWRSFSGDFFSNIQMFFICGNIAMVISFGAAASDMMVLHA